MVDKDNGGKADALNAGVNAARYPYVCAVDADAIIEHDALLRVAKPLLDDPDLVVATGGIVRIANGCTIEDGRVHRGAAADQPARDAAGGRVLPRVPGRARGLEPAARAADHLRRVRALPAVHRRGRRRLGLDARSARTWSSWCACTAICASGARTTASQFVPDPVCWTEAPETLKVLSRQRRRWQRGLAETLWRHKTMTLNPKYGVLGMLAMPYFIVFELLGPPLALLGYIVLPVSWALGMVSWPFVLAFFVFAVMLGQLLSISALALEEFSFRRHPRGREILRMSAYAAVENLGYRQLTDLWRGIAFWDLLRGRKSWGDMQRRGFQTAPADQVSEGN